MAVRILHCADFHLDSPFTGIGEKKAHEMRVIQRKILNNIKETAIAEKCDVILLSGDLFDSASPGMETVAMLDNIIADLEIPVFYSPGNHDYAGGITILKHLKQIPNLYVFNSNSIEEYTIDSLKLHVFGAGFTSHDSVSLLRGFRAPDDDYTSVMVIHGNVGGSNYNPISTEDIENSNLDYLALGHNHTFSGIRTAGRTVYAWPGTPQGRGFDECGAKGIIIGTVGKNSTDLSFFETSQIRYEELTLDVSECATDFDVIAKVSCGALWDRVIRLILVGEYDGIPDVHAIADGIGAYHAVTIDHTHEKRDLWSSVSEDSLKGSFVRIMKDKLDAAENEDERTRIIRALKMGVAALENRREWLSCI